MSKARDLADSVAAGSVLADGVVSLSEIGSASGVNLSFVDNSKAIFGTGSDLQIYHNPALPGSLIEDVGSGDLIIKASNQIRFQDGSSNHYAIFNEGTSVDLYYNNALKLATTSTGIDVTGTVVSDGLTVDGSSVINSSRPSLIFSETDTTNANSLLLGNASTFRIKTVSDDFVTETNRFTIDHATGDISFYEDTGTTAKFFWDASAESLGIGTSSPTATLDVTTTDATPLSVNRSDTGSVSIKVSNSTHSTYLGTRTGGGFAIDDDSNLADGPWLLIDNDGNMLVGKTTSNLSVVGHEFLAIGKAYHTQDGGAPVILNRLTSDGDIAVFRKDGTTVGSIGVDYGDDIYIANGAVGLFFNNSSATIQPYGGGTLSDNAVNLGSTTSRFKSIYLSGGVYVGGTGAANYLEDYEEGTWDPVIADASSGGNIGSATVSYANYTKVGRLVTVSATIGNINTTGMTSSNPLYVRGLPFTSSSSNNAYGVAVSDSVIFQGGRTTISSVVGVSDSWVLFYVTGNAFTDTPVDIGDITSGTADIFFNVTYTV